MRTVFLSVLMYSAKPLIFWMMGIDLDGVMHIQFMTGILNNNSVFNKTICIKPFACMCHV